MSEHGGRLFAAARAYGIPVAQWLDLSTGVNPNGWPVPALPPSCWQRLPDDDDGLIVAATAYYGNAAPLPVAGSQAALQVLPHVFPLGQMACVDPVYAEHPEAWQHAGHTVCPQPDGDLRSLLATGVPYVLVCNPNNPTAHRYSRADLLAAAQQMRQRGGWLIVDEAFIDGTPEDSVMPWAGTEAAPNLIVLRSLGKFFGLAGARVGFLCAAQDIRDRMAAHLGPWTVSGPGRVVARRALSDTAWQTKARTALIAAGQRLAARVASLGAVMATPLFATVATPQSLELHRYLATCGILTRHFPRQAWLRFGLPGSEADWERLDTALSQYC